jgi:hypothetical protein
MAASAPAASPSGGHSSSCLDPRRQLPLEAFLDPSGGVDCGGRETSVGGDKNESGTVKIRIRMTSNFCWGARAADGRYYMFHQVKLADKKYISFIGFKKFDEN